MKFLNLAVLLSLIMFAGCSKNEEQEAVLPKCKNVVHPPQEFLDYWFVPKGSWWVYKLKGSEPAVYDTVRLSGLHKEYYLEPYADTIGPDCEMLYRYEMIHSNLTYFPNPDSSQPKKEVVSGYKYLFGGWVIQTNQVIFRFPFAVGTSGGWQYDTNAVVLPNFTLTNSVSVNGQFFDPEINDNYSFKTSFTKGIGITYRRLINGTEWELVNYQIAR